MTHRAIPNWRTPHLSCSPRLLVPPCFPCRTLPPSPFIPQTSHVWTSPDLDQCTFCSCYRCHPLCVICVTCPLAAHAVIVELTSHPFFYPSGPIRRHSLLSEAPLPPPICLHNKPPLFPPCHRCRASSHLPCPRVKVPRSCCALGKVVKPSPSLFLH
jgi:hypothetical protein